MNNHCYLSFSESQNTSAETTMKNVATNKIQLSAPPINTYYEQSMAVNDGGSNRYYIGIDKPMPNYKIDNRISNVLILNFVIDGKGSFNGMPFSQGTFYYTKPRIPYTMIADSEEPWHSIWVSIEGERRNELIEKLDAISQNQMATFSSPFALLHLVQYILYEFPHSNSSFQIYDGMISQLISFIRPFGESYEPQEQDTRHDQSVQIVQQAITYINTNPTTVTVAELAKKMNFEHTYFTHLFTSVKGISPKEYILNVKLKIAKHYLAETNYSIEQITDLMGYNHRNSLTSLFKKKLGISPNEYRLHFQSKDQISHL